MADHENTEQANLLKEEGNALFIKKDYALASAKYTEAIELDNKNAVLYANRAACRLALRQFLDACTDATKATELDPLYSKAYARAATAHDALKNFTLSVDAWQRALNTFPNENLTPGEFKQKEQYEAGLKAARIAMSEAQRPVNVGIHINPNHKKMPWALALPLLPSLEERQEVTSSAWVIHGAYQDFSRGVDAMKSLYKQTQSRTATMAKGDLHGLDSLTNGIMRDLRVFHIDDPNWVSIYNTQVRFEMMSYKAWADAGPERVIEEAQKRLPTEGWARVRPAISTTIRAWIMRGAVEGGLTAKHDVAVEFLGRAIEVINWGRTAWKKVPYTDRGIIFKDTFLFGLRSMYLESFMMAHRKDPGLNSKFSLEELYEDAKDLVRSIDNRGPDSTEPVDPGFISSFIVYPKAHAIAMQGFYHAQMARLKASDDAAMRDHHLEAAMLYMEGAMGYPDDDEYYAWFLSCALTNMWGCGTPVKDQLKVMEKIRLSMPKMQKIWANSAMANQGRDKTLEDLLVQEKVLLERIERKEIKLSDCISLSFSQN